MRINLFVGSALFISLQLQAQHSSTTPQINSPRFVSSSTYQPILNNSVWLSSEVEIEGYINSLFTIVGDTIINGTNYKIFYKEYIDLPGINNNPWISGYDSLYFREDNTSRKFYQYYQWMGEQTIFDFSMQIGDSLPSLNYPGFAVTNIDSISTNQGFRRRLVFTHATYPPIIWVESIGNLTMPFLKDAFYDTTYAQVLCVHSLGNLVYEYQNYVPVTCSLYNSVHQTSSKSNDIEIFPNPTLGHINILFNSDSFNSEKELQVYNSLGELVLTRHSNEIRKLELDLSSLHEGIYLLRISGENQMWTKNIVVR